MDFWVLVVIECSRLHQSALKDKRFAESFGNHYNYNSLAIWSRQIF